MAKFYGVIGYSTTEETAKGVWTDVIIERTYTGDVLKNLRQWRDNGNVNPDDIISDTISIIADGFILENPYSMKYVKWRGETLAIVSVVVERPRVIIAIGGLFNGNTSSGSTGSTGG